MPRCYSRSSGARGHAPPPDQLSRSDPATTRRRQRRNGVSGLPRAMLKYLHFDIRPVVAALHDGLALAAAFIGALALLQPGASSIDLEPLLLAFAVAIPIQVVVNVLFGIYQ